MWLLSFLCVMAPHYWFANIVPILHAWENPHLTVMNSFLLESGDSSVTESNLPVVSLLFWPLCPSLRLPGFTPEPSDEGLLAGMRSIEIGQAGFLFVGPVVCRSLSEGRVVPTQSQPLQSLSETPALASSGASLLIQGGYIQFSPLQEWA